MEQHSKNAITMKKNLILSVFISVSSLISSQVGINTLSPETTFEVAGKPDDPNHYDGILPPRITGDQLSKKTYSASKKGTLLFITEPPTNLSGQLAKISEPGLYCFNGSLWQLVEEQKQIIDYRIILNFDNSSDHILTSSSKWSEPTDLWGDKNTYLTSTKFYSIGTEKLGGLQGSVTFNKVEGLVNVKFQISSDPDLNSTNEDIILDVSEIFNEMGYFPTDVIFLHTEYPTFIIPIYLQNNSILIPKVNFSYLTSNFFGETQGYSSFKNPHLK